MSGWMSKSTGVTAHYVEADGKASCALMGRAPFRASFVPLDERHHLCRECKRKHPRECRCGVCGVRPARAPARRRRVRTNRSSTTWGVWCSFRASPKDSGWMHDNDPSTPARMTQREAEGQARRRNATADPGEYYEARPLPEATP